MYVAWDVNKQLLDVCSMIIHNKQLLDVCSMMHVNKQLLDVCSMICKQTITGSM